MVKPLSGESVRRFTAKVNTMKNVFFLICSVFLLASCVSSRYTYQDGVEDDDIYFSSNDADYVYDDYVTEKESDSGDYVEEKQDDYYEDDYYSDGYSGGSGGDTYIDNYYGNTYSSSPWRSRYFSPYYGHSPHGLGYAGSNIFLQYDPFNGWSYGFNFNYPFGGYYSNYPYGYSNYYYGYSAWGWCDPYYSYHHPYSYYNPYGGYGYAGYGYGGYGNGGYYGNDYFGNNGNGNGVHYGHITPISTESGTNSGYTGNTIFEPIRDRPISQLIIDRPEDNISIVMERPSGVSNKLPAASNDDTATIRPNNEKNPGGQTEPSTRPSIGNSPDVLASVNNDFADTRPAKVEDDYHWRAPQREPKPKAQDNSRDRDRDLNNSRNSNSKQSSRYSGSDSWNRPSGQRPSNRPARTGQDRPSDHRPAHQQQRPRDEYNQGRNDRGRDNQRQDSHQRGNSNGNARQQDRSPSINRSGNSGRSGNSSAGSSGSSRSGNSSKSSGSRSSGSRSSKSSKSSSKSSGRR